MVFLGSSAVIDRNRHGESSKISTILPGFRQVAQNAMPILGHQDIVLDPYATKTREVDSRFDGDHHIGLERAVLPACQSHGLMDLETERMPQPMGEFFSETR